MSDTVRVRIAVAVNCDGKYEAAGADNQTDEGRRGYAEMWMEERGAKVDAVYFAEVSVPMAPPQTIEGEVESEPEGGR